jgi:phosphopantothenoylcysteine synthetase/decarboxylase
VLLGVTGSVAAVKWEALALLLLPWADVRVLHSAAGARFAPLCAGYAPEAHAAWLAAAAAARGGADGCAVAAEAVAAAGADAALPPPSARLGLLLDACEWGGSFVAVGSDAVPHIELRRWADLLIIAPCSANTLARLAGGAADNLLTCVARAWPFSGGAEGGAAPRVAKPVLVAPAMNTAMWEHPVTAQHLRTLEGWGFTIVPPVEKRLACGDVGVGAMAAVELVAAAAQAALGLLGGGGGERRKTSL